MLTYQWCRNNTPIPGADGPDHIVVAEDVGSYLRCAVTAEGRTPRASGYVYPSWEPLRVGLLPDTDATAPNASNAYTLRVRNDNPVPVTITTLELTMPGGFSYRPGTTTGALTTDPALTGPGLADAALDDRLPGPRVRRVGGPRRRDGRLGTR